MLDRFMKLSLCKSIQLDGIDIYTNHSIWATVISHLDKSGFEACHIIALSSHKSEATIKEYSVVCPSNKRKEMFESLNSALVPKTKKNPATVTSASSPLPELTVQDVKQNLPYFDLTPLDDMKYLDDKTLQELFSDFPIDTDKKTEPKNNQQNKENK